jgi:hypothetical protein
MELTIMALIVGIILGALGIEIASQARPVVARVWAATPRWVVWAVGIVLWGVFLWTC